MNLSFRSYHQQCGSTEATLLSGAGEGTIVKSLELIANSSPATVRVVRKQGGTTLSTITVPLTANDYLLLWEGFFVVEHGQSICVSTTSGTCTAVANVVEMEQS